MTTRSVVRSWWLAWILVCMAFAPARADFEVVDDFEAALIGPVDGLSGWSGGDTASVVALDPALSTNQVLAVGSESVHLYRELWIPEGVTRMLFFRFRFTDQVRACWGPSSEWDPDFLEHLDVELGLDDTAGSLCVADGGAISVLATLQPDRWYNCWLLIDHDGDELRIWLHSRGGDSANSGDLLTAGGQEVYGFGNFWAGDLLGFHIVPAEESGLTGVLFVDDIYLEDSGSLNLTNPALPLPSGLSPGADSAAVWSRVSPNPFRSRVEIEYALPRPGDPTLQVFDAEGRLLTGLTVDPMGQSAGQCVWNGRDADGRTVAAGVYYLRLTAGAEAWTRRIVRIE